MDETDVVMEYRFDAVNIGTLKSIIVSFAELESLKKVDDGLRGFEGTGTNVEAIGRRPDDSSSVAI